MTEPTLAATVERDPDLGAATPPVAPTTPGPYLDKESNTAAATWALFVGIGFLMLGNGLQGSVVGIRSQSEGFSTTSTGIVMTAFFIGFLVGSRTVTRVLATVGHIRVFAALASMASSALLVYAMAVTPPVWFFMRFITGFCMAGLYVVAESWINDLATNKTRGRLLGVYMVVSMGGLAGGQLLLNVTSPDGFELFVIASVLVSLALVPITLSATSAPPTRTPTPMPLRELARIVPTGLAISLFVGMAHGSLLGMGAVYATSADLRPSQVAIFMGAPMIGGVIFQLPIGLVSDRVPRRAVMLIVALIATACGFGLLIASPGSPASYLLMFLLGGASFPLYSLGIAYTNDWIEPHQIMGASSGLVTVNGIGAVLGPLLAAGLILAFGNDLYLASLIVTHGAIVIYVAFRIVTKDGLSIDDQNRFRPFPARASALAVNLGRRRR